MTALVPRIDSRRTAVCAALMLVSSLSFAACGDPVKSAAVDALGGEAPGVHQGPLHRPGQPCLLCHDGSLGDPEAFSVAGTVFQTPSSAVGSDGVVVHLIDSTGTRVDVTTNAAGNFYIPEKQWGPTFPLSTSIEASGGVVVSMQSRIGRDGACASCHVAPAGPTSPGRVVIELDDGGTPP